MVTFYCSKHAKSKKKSVVDFLYKKIVIFDSNFFHLYTCLILKTYVGKCLHSKYHDTFSITLSSMWLRSKVYNVAKMKQYIPKKMSCILLVCFPAHSLEITYILNAMFYLT